MERREQKEQEASVYRQPQDEQGLPDEKLMENMENKSCMQVVEAIATEDNPTVPTAPSNPSNPG